MIITSTSHPNKIFYPIHCKRCGKHITNIEISKDLWEEKNADDLGISNIKCDNCKNK